MGIDINYDFAFRGSKDQLLEKLASVRNKISTRNVQSVDQVIEIPSTGFSPEAAKANPISISLAFSMLAYFQPERFPAENEESFKDKIVSEGNGAGFYVEVAEGCEPFSLFLGRFGQTDKWFGSAFTDTTGADDFLGTHQTVIDILKTCDDAGILESVDDEVGMWGKTDTGFEHL